MQRVFLYYVLFLSVFYAKEKKDLLWLFKQSNKGCITYDFEHSKNNVLNAFENGCQLESIAKEIQKNGFTFNPHNDTVLVCMQFVDDLVISCKSFFSKTYYSPPTEIDVFSSIGESHLRLMYDAIPFYYKKLQNDNGLYKKTDYLTQLMVNNDIDGFIPFYEEYGVLERDVTHECNSHHIRIEIKDGKICSVTNWIFLLEWFKYMDSEH